MQRLHAVVSWLQEDPLKLQPTKCDFFKTSAVYLGHEISKEGIQTDDHRLKLLGIGPSQVWLLSYEAFLGL